MDFGAYESDIDTRTAQTITFTSPATGAVGGKIALTATASSGLPVTFAITVQTPTSGSGNLATLTDNTLSLTGLGTVTITATQAGNATYVTTTQTQTITVRDPLIRRVTTGGDSLADGSTWAAAMTLQAALAASTTPGDQVWIAAGIYKPHASDRTATFTIPAGILVYGGFDPVADAADIDASSRSGGATILSGDLLGDDGTRPVRPPAGEDQTAYNAARVVYDASRDDNSNTMVTIAGENVTLDGLTITAGESAGNGAGLSAGFTGTTLMGCTFTGNEAGGSGGAIFGGTATLTSCTFTGNEARIGGGGVRFFLSATLTACTFTDNRVEGVSNGLGGGAYFDKEATLTGCTFTGNVSDRSAGGAFFRREAAMLTGCTFMGNVARFQGGGANFGSPSTLTACTFTDNEANVGGGAYFSRGETMLTNCVLVGNTATASNGGGLFLRSGGTVINSTLYNNTANDQGGGVFFTTSAFYPSNLRNSILVGNTATGDVSGQEVYVSNMAGHAMNIQNNLIAGGADPMGTDQGVVYQTPGSGNITQTGTIDAAAAAVFASTDAMNDNYLRLKTGSPAVNAGNNLYLDNGTPDDIKTDAAGNARIQGGTVDMGAYESDPLSHTGDITVTTQTEVDSLLTTLAGKTSIDGNLTIGYTDFSSSRSNITDLTPLSNIVRITESLTIQQNGQLANLNGLDSLQSIGGFLFINSNDALEALGDLSALTRIGGYLYIGSNGALETIGDLSALTSIEGYLNIQDNGALETLGDLSALTRIGGFLFINSNGALETLGDLSALTRIGGFLFINSNDALKTLGDLSALTSIEGHLNIGVNDALKTLGDLSALESIEGEVYIEDNGALETLGDFSALTSIGMFLYISENDALKTLGDLSALTSIGGYVSIGGNDALETLGDLSALTSIGGYFLINYNDKLLSLGDFPALTSIGIGTVHVPSLGDSRDSVSIVLEDNTNLVLCSWLEEFIPTGTHAVIGGIYINNNASGCNSTEEIDNSPPVLLAENHLFTHKDSTTTSFNIYANVRWQLATSDDATWITSVSSDSSTHSSRITGEYEATITLIHTRAPDATQRSTTLTLTAIDEEGNELTNPAIITIHFTQLPTVYEGNITLRSQEEVNEFISNTTLIDGNLTIGYTGFTSSRSNITDLTPLSNITDITGNLNIENNEQLNNLSNLNSLQIIGGFFNVNKNDSLTDLGDFSVLQTIGEDFQVSTNAKLTDLGDFSALQTIGGLFYVTNNDTLTTLGNFPALTSIGIGSASIPSLSQGRNNVSIVVEDNSSLSDCYVLTEFLPGGDHAVSGKIYVNNNALGCNSGDEIIAAVPHTIMLTSHTDGESIAIAYDEVVAQTIIFSIGGGATGWTSATTGDDFITLDTTMNVAQDTGVAITVRATPTKNTGVERSAVITFTTTGGGPAASATVTIRQAVLPDYIYLGDITVTTQTEVDSLRTTLAGKTGIDGNLIIGGSSDITDLTPLSNMTHITGNLRIQQNGQLANLNGLDSLQSIGGFFYVGYNNDLTDLGDFPVLDSIGGLFNVRDNSDLTDLGDFSCFANHWGIFLCV